MSATMTQSAAMAQPSGMRSAPAPRPSVHARTSSSSSLAQLRRQSRDKAHAELTSFTAIKTAGSSPEDEQEHARVAPKRNRSKVGIASMQSGTEALKRSKHDRGKGSTASLKSLGHERRKSGVKHREVHEPDADAAWVSASGDDSAPPTPEKHSRPSSRGGRPPAEDLAQPGSTPTAFPSMPRPSADLAATPTRPFVPPLAHATGTRTESPPKTAPLPADGHEQSSDVAFPSASAPASPVVRRGRTSRMPSSSSIASRLSTRSIRQPLSAVVTLAPQLDSSQGIGMLSSSPASPLTTIDEPRASTSKAPIVGDSSRGAYEGSNLASKLRETQTRGLQSSSSRASLSRLSGQFGGALRGFLPMPATSASPTKEPSPPHHGRQMTRSSTAGSMPRPLVSKFISPSELSPSVETAYMSSPMEAKTTPSSSSSGTRLNRTQQRLLLQRAQPYRDTEVSPNARATLLPPLNASTSPDDVAELNFPERQLQSQQAQQTWAKLLCREAERVEREHECVLRYRDPAGESFRRILAANRDRGRSNSIKHAAIANDAKGKQRRPESLHRSQTMR